MINQHLEELVELQREVSSEIALLELLYAALNAVPNVIIITDAEGNIIWVNAIFELYTGYTFKEIKGQNPRVFKSGVHDVSFYKTMWETVRGGNVWHGKVVNKYKDGILREEEMTITPVSKDNNSLYFVAMKQLIGC